LNWENIRVLVTGGASFIGSHLSERLIQLGANVRIADNLSSGKISNINSIRKHVEFIKGDLLEYSFAAEASRDCEVVFHLAADHGGRGYIATRPPSCLKQLKKLPFCVK